MNCTQDAYCRLCAELKPHNKLKNLQTDEKMCEKIVNKLSRFNIDMDFNENILPKTVCLVCTRSLDRAFTFVAAVEQAQAALCDFILIQPHTNESNMNDENISYESPEGLLDQPNTKREDNYNEPMDISKSNVVLNPILQMPGLKHEDIINVKDKNINSSVELNPIFQMPGQKNEDIINVKDENINYEYPELIDSDTNESKEDDIKTNNDNNYIDINNKYDNKYGMNFIKEDNIFDEVNNISVEYPNLNKNDNSKEDNLRNLKQITQTSSKSKDSNSEPQENEENSIDFINKEINRLAAVPIQHIKMTWKDFCWKCSLCETQFSNFHELRNHAMQYHNTCNPYTCPDCNATKVRLDKFLRHVRTHRKYLHYSCFMCDMKFSDPAKMRLHKSKHKVTEHMCLGCNTNYESKQDLEKHVTTFYKNVWSKNIRNKMPKDGHKCTICNKKFETSCKLRLHSFIHTDRIKNHICEICGKAYYTEDLLKVHMFTHSDVRSHQCEICKQSFKNINRLRCHTKVHSDIKPFSCDECGKCFRTKRQLVNHLEIHTDSLPFVCTICNKGFRRNAYLKRHMRQHTGVKPYSCDICPRDFTDWANWNKHMNRKHGKEMAKKKHTPLGPHAVDPDTGKVIYPEPEKMLEWKKKMKELLQPKVRCGRMKIKKTGKIVINQDGLFPLSPSRSPPLG